MHVLFILCSCKLSFGSFSFRCHTSEYLLGAPHQQLVQGKQKPPAGGGGAPSSSILGHWYWLFELLKFIPFAPQRKEKIMVKFFSYHTNTVNISEAVFCNAFVIWFLVGAVKRPHLISMHNCVIVLPKTKSHV